MNKYSKYKNSGVEWIGQIPSEWKVSKFKYVCEIFNGDSLNDDQKLLFESDNPNDIPYISSKDINVNNLEINYNNGLRIPNNNKLKRGEKGGFLLCIEGGSSGKKMSFLEQDVCFVNKLCYFKSTHQNTKFLFYFIRSFNFQFKFFQSMTGLIGGVSISIIKNFELILPPLDEQLEIVKYLDEKTTQIDNLISLTEKKIERLKEKKTSLINTIVTKGLDTNVEMKDSGVEWIGSIPSHWDKVTVRYLFKKIGSGVTPRGGSEVYIDEGITFIRSQNVHFDGLRLDDVVKIDYETHKKMSGTKIQLNDVLLNITGGSIGRCCIVNTNQEMNVNQHVCIIRTNKRVIPSFLNFILLSNVGQTQVDLNITGGNREGLNIDSIKNIFVPLPNIIEQEEIVKYLDTVTHEIDNLISIENRRIDTLKEFRQSLISEVITGKIRVCEEYHSFNNSIHDFNLN